jgi:hypothetical protein
VGWIIRSDHSFFEVSPLSVEEPVVAHQFLVVRAAQRCLDVLPHFLHLQGLLLPHEAVVVVLEAFEGVLGRPVAVPPVGLPLDGRERDLSLDYLILLLPGALELLLLGRLVGDEEGEDPVVVGGRLFLEVREVGGDVEDIFEELPAAVVERFIGYFAVVFELDLPRAISGLLAVGGDVEGVLLLALAVAAEAQVLEDLLLDLHRAGDAVLFAHRFHH